MKLMLIKLDLRGRNVVAPLVGKEVREAVWGTETTSIQVPTHQSKLDSPLVVSPVRFMNSKITYRQQYTRCGKERCRKCKAGAGHGPYWYAYWSENARTVSKYIAIRLP